MGTLARSRALRDEQWLPGPGPEAQKQVSTVTLLGYMALSSRILEASEASAVTEEVQANCNQCVVVRGSLQSQSHLNMEFFLSGAEMPVPDVRKMVYLSQNFP